jgi:hypothetical protein
VPELILTENPEIGLKKAAFEFEDWVRHLEPAELEELANWVKFAVLFFVRGREHRLREDIQKRRDFKLVGAEASRQDAKAEDLF